MHRDRRGAERFEIVGQLFGSLRATESLPVRNLGSGGALLEAPFPLDVGSVHRIQTAVDERPLDLTARVRHVRGVGGSGRYLIGLEFVDLPARVQAEIDALVAGTPGAAWLGPPDES